MKVDPTGQAIDDALHAVLDDEGVRQWWDIYVPALGCTPMEAAEQGRADEILAVAVSYSDPSYS